MIGLPDFKTLALDFYILHSKELKWWQCRSNFILSLQLTILLTLYQATMVPLAKFEAPCATHIIFVSILVKHV